MSIFKKSSMELNVLRTEDGYIDLPKEIIYRSGDHIIINDKEYVIEIVKYHVHYCKIFQNRN
jgi:hypothetical protein